MPQYVALKTFLGEYGSMHRGMTYTLPLPYGNALRRNGLVREMAIQQAPRNVAHQEAPRTAGEGTVAQPADGKEPPSSVSHPARRSHRKTAGTLNRGPK